MRGSSEPWRPARLALFLALGAALHLALFLWSDALLRQMGQRNPFARAASPPEQGDWVVLGASHALPLGFADMGQVVQDRTGRRLLVLASAGSGPFIWRLVAERHFRDHRARGLLIVVDAFALSDARWNADRLDDADMLPKMPQDLGTLAVLTRALPRGLPWQSWLAYATGLARINDRNRLAPDVWAAEARFDNAPRAQDAAISARLAFLYPGPPDARETDRRLADLAAIIALARDRGARVVILRPPLPASFRQAMPALPRVEQGLARLGRELGVPILDFSDSLPEQRLYLDSDHLNRAGVLAWLDGGLAQVLSQGLAAQDGGDDGGQ